MSEVTEGGMVDMTAEWAVAAEEAAVSK